MPSTIIAGTVLLLVAAATLGVADPSDSTDAADDDTCTAPRAAQIQNASVPDGFCAWVFADGLGSPRGILVDDAGDVLVVQRSGGSIVRLFDADGDGVVGLDERQEVAAAPGLNHGIAIGGGHLYASSASAVYRWPYPGDRRPLGDAEVVIDGIPARGSHRTRTLALDDRFLYVSVGSGSNVDRDSSRARIRRFPIGDLGGGVIDFEMGEVFADGLRNEVGLGFDGRGRLWGVENGQDGLRRADFSPADIHEDNPAEELNLFEEGGRFYGYPYCWTEFRLPGDEGLGPGTQWAEGRFMDDGTHTDAWCRDTDNVMPPVLAMQGHSAPLDVLFYPGGSFPEAFTGDAIVTFHGSWNRAVPTGYKVVRIPFGDDGLPEGEPEPLLEYAGDGDVSSDWPHRPVGLATTADGLLLVTSDRSDSVLAIGHAP